MLALERGRGVAHSCNWRGSSGCSTDPFLVSHSVETMTVLWVSEWQHLSALKIAYHIVILPCHLLATWTGQSARCRPEMSRQRCLNLLVLTTISLPTWHFNSSTVVCTRVHCTASFDWNVQRWLICDEQQPATLPRQHNCMGSNTTIPHKLASFYLEGYRHCRGETTGTTSRKNIPFIGYFLDWRGRPQPTTRPRRPTCSHCSIIWWRVGSGLT